VRGVASAQARAPARRDVGSEFQALGHVELMERSPTVFNLKSGTAKGRSHLITLLDRTKLLFSSLVSER